MQKTILSIALTAFCCLSSWAQYPYKVIAPIPQSQEGDLIYMYDYDKGVKLDSAQVNDGAVVFVGEIDEPIMVRLIDAKNARHGTFALEQGTFAVNPASRQAVGSMLNDSFNALMDSLDAVAAKYANDNAPDARERIMKDYDALLVPYIEENIDNPMGYYTFLISSSLYDEARNTAFVESHPQLKDYRRVQTMLANYEKVKRTQPGQPFVDFEVTYNGETKKLSDYVGKGQYVLVDFWASWCGPCRQEIRETLKDLYADFTDKGLKMLGVAVWDEPEQSLQAINSMQLPWENILNAQSIPTDAYGIEGIPTLILFAPDGTIVNRTARGPELRALIESIYSSKD